MYSERNHLKYYKGDIYQDCDKSLCIFTGKYTCYDLFFEAYFHCDNLIIDKCITIIFREKSLANT